MLTVVVGIAYKSSLGRQAVWLRSACMLCCDPWRAPSVGRMLYLSAAACTNQPLSVHFDDAIDELEAAWVDYVINDSERRVVHLNGRTEQKATENHYQTSPPGCAEQVSA